MADYPEGRYPDEDDPDSHTIHDERIKELRAYREFVKDQNLAIYDKRKDVVINAALKEIGKRVGAWTAEDAMQNLQYRCDLLENEGRKKMMDMAVSNMMSVELELDAALGRWLEDEMIVIKESK